MKSSDAARISILTRFAAVCASAEEPADIFSAALETVMDGAEADRASLLLFDADGVLRFKAWRHLSDGYRAAVEGHTPWSRDTVAAEPVVVPDVGADPALEAYRSVILAEGIRALAFVPIAAEGQLFGKLMVYFDRPKTLADHALHVAEAVASGVGAAVARARTEDSLRLLLRAGDLLHESLEYETRLAALGKLCVPAVADLAVIYVPDRAGGVRRLHQTAADPEKARILAELDRGYPITADVHGNVVLEVFRTGESIFHPAIPAAVVEAAARDEQHLRLLRRLNPRSAIVAPMKLRDEIVGVLALAASESGRRYTQRDRALADELAHRAAVAVENARLFEAEREARERTERLQRITSDLAGVLPAERVARLFVDQVREAFAADTAWLGTLTEDRSEFVALGHVGFAEAGIAPWLHYPVDAPVPSRDIAADEQPRWFRSAAEFLDSYPAVRETLERIEQEAVAFLPLVAGGRLTGVMTLGFRHVREFSEGDRQFALALAQQCAQALERARLYEAERTARNEAENARDAAEAASRAKSQFLAIMSHELRTPLTAIIGYSHLLAEGITAPVSDEQRAQLERIHASAQHLLTLIDDVLLFSRLEAEYETPQPEPTDVGALTREAAAMVVPSAELQGLSFSVDAPADGACTIETDPRMVRQILLNLLSNAVRFTPEGAVTLTARAADGEMRWAVRDTGVGIAEHDLDRIFRPFEQVDVTLTRRIGGAGLGLAVCRHLARLLGGDLEVASEVGRGSTFTLRLPRRQPMSGPRPSPGG